MVKCHLVDCQLCTNFYLTSHFLSIHLLVFLNEHVPKYCNLKFSLNTRAISMCRKMFDLTVVAEYNLKFAKS